MQMSALTPDLQSQKALEPGEGGLVLRPQEWELLRQCQHIQPGARTRRLPAQVFSRGLSSLDILEFCGTNVCPAKQAVGVSLQPGIWFI